MPYIRLKMVTYIQYAKRYAVDPGPPVSHELLEAADMVMIENNLYVPLSVEEVLDFYLALSICLLSKYKVIHVFYK